MSTNEPPLLEASGQKKNTQDPGVVVNPSCNGSGETTALESQSGDTTHKATGPRTPAGKERSKRNALKHGIFSKVALLKGESRSQYNSLLNGLQDDIRPEGKREEVLVDKLATLFWRYRRFIIADVDNAQDGRILELDLEIKQYLTDRLLKCEAGINREIDRTLTQIERFQRMRLGQPVSSPIKLDISSS